MKKKELDMVIELLVGAVRNSNLEDLHSGITPTSKTGDFSDVKVVTPYGEISWDKLSRISDDEMGILKDSIREEITYQINMLITNGLEMKIKKDSIFEKLMKKIRNNKK